MCQKGSCDGQLLAWLQIFTVVMNALTRMRQLRHTRLLPGMQGSADGFGGEFTVPSYRGATFLDPKGRGAATGYDTAVALPAAGDAGTPLVVML